MDIFRNANPAHVRHCDLSVLKWIEDKVCYIIEREMATQRTSYSKYLYYLSMTDNSQNVSKNNNGQSF